MLKNADLHPGNCSPNTLQEFGSTIPLDDLLLSQALLNNLIHSVENYCKTFVSDRSDHIPYLFIYFNFKFSAFGVSFFTCFRKGFIFKCCQMMK